MQKELLIGWSEVDLTPDCRIGLAGQFFERITDQVETPVTATALAVESGGDQMVLCSCDLVHVGAKLQGRVREILRGEPGLDTDKVILSAIHTHTSFEYDNTSDQCTSSLSVLERLLPAHLQVVHKVSGERMGDGEALEYLSLRIARAISQAWSSRKPSCYANEFGRAAVGMCRRVVYDDGTARMWGDTSLANFAELEGGNDSGIELLYTFDEEKKLTGVAANVACPAQVVEHRSFISSDYWGKVKILLREKFGEKLYILGLCSAAGDQCPRDMIRWVNPETPIDDPNIRRDDCIQRKADVSMFDIKGSWKVGRRIANEILSVYEEISELRDSTELCHKVLHVDLPLRRVTMTEYKNALREIDRFIREKRGDVTFEDNAAMHVYAGTVARYEDQQRQNIHTAEIHVLRFGDLAIATNPFELFLDYGNRIRSRSRAKQTVLIQLACGSDGYLPTEKAEKGGHYSAYVSSGLVGHEGGDMLVRRTVETINGLWRTGNTPTE